MSADCGTCKFYKPMDFNDGDKTLRGVCRRHAPVQPHSVRPYYPWGWPVVLLCDWCGDYEEEL